MLKKMCLVLGLAGCLLPFSACKKNIDLTTEQKKKDYPALGDTVIDVFKESPVLCDWGLKGFQEKDGFIQLINGRVILKKVELPKYLRDVKLSMKIRLVSAGDDFDRSGSCFIIPCGDGISMLDIAKGAKKYPEQSEKKLKKYPGIIGGENYLPAVEALRFMTPFGIGFYNDKMTPPSGIEKWEDEVVWKADISHLFPLFENGAYVGIWIDTWNAGFKVDVKITAEESKENKAGKKKHIASLINTVPYAGQNYPDVFSDTDINVKTTIPENSENVRLYYTTTGHGGYDGGDEFTKRENVIKLDSKKFQSFIPWIETCKPFRKFNPSSRVFSGGIASSDLARSNWCPGSDVPPKIYPVADTFKGEHTFTFSVVDANPSWENHTNFWLVSSYLAWEEKQ